MDFNPQPITPNFRQLGKIQKYILKKMAREGYTISLLMYRDEPDDITLMDLKGNEDSAVKPSVLEGLGKRGLLKQHTKTPEMSVTIVTYTLKDEVLNHFKQTPKPKD